jgi:3'(2'), 5'-bisphosphate nucleotidase
VSDHDDAARYAAEAGQLLVELREQTVLDASSGRPRQAPAHAEAVGEAAASAWRRSALGDAGDVLANRRLLELLRAEHPDDPVLSEELADDPRRHHAPRVWIVDPLDGTREFTEPGRTDWAVHVALWERGELRAGAVALPAQHQLLSTADPPAVPAAADRRLRVVVSRTRPPVAARRVAATLDADLVAMGSAGAKAMAVVTGEVDAYVHAGGQYEWDSAAPVAVAGAAGLHVSRLDGSPLVYNRPDPWLPDLVVCRPELADAIVAAAAVV